MMKSRIGAEVVAWAHCARMRLKGDWARRPRHDPGPGSRIAAEKPNPPDSPKMSNGEPVRKPLRAPWRTSFPELFPKRCSAMHPDASACILCAPQQKSPNEPTLFYKAQMAN